MKFALYVATYLAGIPLEVMVISAMLRGAYRSFPAAFAYVTALFLTSVLETAFLVAGLYFDTSARSIYLRLYWVDERVLIALVFVVVIGLVYRATAKAAARRPLRALLIAGAVLYAGIALWSHYDSRLDAGQWITPWAIDLNFCAAILDLALWAMLIAPRKKDRVLLMLAGGLGIQFAGQAIGEAVRQIAQSTYSAALSASGGVVIILANLTFLYVWRQAFVQAMPPGSREERSRAISAAS